MTKSQGQETLWEQPEPSYPPSRYSHNTGALKGVWTTMWWFCEGVKVSVYVTQEKSKRSGIVLLYMLYTQSESHPTRASSKCTGVGDSERTFTQFLSSTTYLLSSSIISFHFFDLCVTTAPRASFHLAVTAAHIAALSVPPVT